MNPLWVSDNQPAEYRLISRVKLSQFSVLF